MTDIIRWPVAIYFDTSILWKLPPDLSNPDLVKLHNFATELRIGLFVPDVAAKEWLFHHHMLQYYRINKCVDNKQEKKIRKEQV